MNALINRATRFFWIIPLLVIALNLAYYYQAIRFTHVLVFGLTGVLGWLLWKKIPITQNLRMISISIIGAVLVYWLYPRIFADDTGFVIRYLNQAADGCFYCFNQSEGPVYGISSFAYGFVTSVLALPGILKPEFIITGVNFLGLIWVLFMLQKIIGKFSSNVFVAFVLVVFVVISATDFLVSTTIGLETNFHLAIVLTGLYAFYYDKRRLFWLFMALSVISKLDTVPLVVILSGTYIIERWKTYFSRESGKAWLQVFLYALLPVIVFVGITYLMFDGPMPQSAQAKIHNHAHPDGHWFPFLQILTDKREWKLLLTAGLSFIVFHGFLSLLRKEFKLSSFAPFLGLIGTLYLFYEYNPGERMVWYYAMPELLFFIQVAISISYVFRDRLYELSTGLSVLGIMITSVILTKGTYNYMKDYFGIVEIERIAIGDYIAETTGEKDTLLAGHGQFGAHTSGYVLDISGLNSEITPEYDLNPYLLVEKFKPQWFIHHADDNLIHVANTFGYTLDRAWFKINIYNYPTWILFKRDASHEPHFYKRLQYTDLSGGELITENLLSAEGDSLSMAFQAGNTVTRVILGVQNMIEAKRSVTIRYGEKDTVFDFDVWELKSIQLPYDAADFKLKIRDNSVKIYDPILEIRK